MAADSPEVKEYLNVKLVFKEFDVSGWNPGEGFWVGIALGSHFMADNPDGVICRMEAYDNTVMSNNNMVCYDVTLKGYAEPTNDSTENLDTRLVSGGFAQTTA